MQMTQTIRNVIFGAIGAIFCFALLFASGTALADELVTCPSCGSAVSEGNYCSNCGAPLSAGLESGLLSGASADNDDQAGLGSDDLSVTLTTPDSVAEAISAAQSHQTIATNPSPDKYTDYVHDYVGRNLASVGYTSLGGDRMDQYGKGYMKLILVTPDGTYVDINDEELLKEYIVIGQSIQPNTEITYTFEVDSDGNEYSNLIDHQSIEEIDLQVARLDGTLYNDLAPYQPTEIVPSPDKYTYSIKNYVGKNLASFGYLSLGGERRDAYGNGSIELVLVSTDGSYVDFSDENQLSSYVVTSQDVAPNTVFSMTYMKDSEGVEYSNLVESQTIQAITLTVSPVNQIAESDA